MAEFQLRVRWGLGPRIDPHFDAKVGRTVVALADRKTTTAFGTGYIELLGNSAHEDLEALLETVFHHLAHGGKLPPWRRRGELIHNRPNVWKQIVRLRYLTTDQSTGVSLPLADFNPDTTQADWPGNAPAQLANALRRLDHVTKGKLKSAHLIGVTVDFEFGVLARRLRRVLQLGILRRMPWMTEQMRRARAEQILFGGLHPWLPKRLFPSALVQRDAQDIALSGGFSPQLRTAMGDLRDAAPMTAVPPVDLDYGIAERGQGVIVGVVDFGCDFAHSSFRNGQASRILALWDQNEPTSGGDPMVTPELPQVMIGTEPLHFGYGRVFKKADIDAVLSDWLQSCPDDSEAPYAKLGYHPHDHHYTSLRPGSCSSAPSGAHGTFVLELAAGNRRSSCQILGIDPPDLPTVAGVAPDADIVFVQVRTHEEDDHRKTLEANDVVDAVAYIFHLADERDQPCVVNVSLNTMSGPHDGDGHFERRLSDLLKSGQAGPQMRGRAVTIAAGNLPYHERELYLWQHVAARVSAGQPFEFHWHPPEGTDQTRNSIEVWYEASDSWLQVSLVSPTGALFGPINPGLAAELIINGKVCGSIIGSRIRPAILDKAAVDGSGSAAQPLPSLSDDHAEGRHVILLALDPVAAAAGCWQVVLAAVDASDRSLPATDPRTIDFHGWLERDDNGQSGISRERSPITPIPAEDRASTIGTLSCGEDAIVVGAYDTRWSPATRWGYSGYGPRRNGGMRKPDVSAPGASLLIIRSTMDKTGARCSLEDGTSLAAPFVTGTIACLYQVDPKAELSTIKTALYSTARKNLLRPGEDWHPQLGHGRLNPHGAVAWMRNGGQSEDA